MDLKRPLPHHQLRSSSWKPNDSTAFKRPRHTGRADTGSHADTNDLVDRPEVPPSTTAEHVETPLFTSLESSHVGDIFRSLAIDDNVTLSFQLERAVTLDDSSFHSDEADTTLPSSSFTPSIKLRMRPSFESNPFYESNLQVGETGFVHDTSCQEGSQHPPALQLLPSRMALQEQPREGFVLETPRVVSPLSSNHPTPPPRIQRQRHDVDHNVLLCSSTKKTSSSLTENILLPTLV